jgi:hypothetical protein
VSAENLNFYRGFVLVQLPTIYIYIYRRLLKFQRFKILMYENATHGQLAPVVAELGSECFPSGILTRFIALRGVG